MIRSRYHTIRYAYIYHSAMIQYNVPCCRGVVVKYSIIPGYPGTYHTVPGYIPGISIIPSYDTVRMQTVQYTSCTGITGSSDTVRVG